MSATGQIAMPDTCVYVGLAGDTDPGRFVSCGLFRHRPGAGDWDEIASGLGQEPEVRAILADPERPGSVMVGTQHGVFGSDDYGESWSRLPAPAPGLAVWSLARHPLEPDIVLAGYEPCEICATHDGGKTWRRLAMAVDFPHATRRTELPKRVTGIAFDPATPDIIYASIEVGGLLCSDDGGQHWHSVTDGLYVTEDALDVHDVLAGMPAPGSVTVATRVGVFQSADGGTHWRSLRIPPLRAKGSYCRRLIATRNGTRRLYVGAGNDFDGDLGALFVSQDDGESWVPCDLGVPLKSTVFALALDPRQPEGVWCATKYGGVIWCPVHGPAQALRPLRKGAGHVFALAAG